MLKSLIFFNSVNKRIYIYLLIFLLKTQFLFSDSILIPQIKNNYLKPAKMKLRIYAKSVGHFLL